MQYACVLDTSANFSSLGKHPFVTQFGLYCTHFLSCTTQTKLLKASMLRD